MFSGNTVLMNGGIFDIFGMKLYIFAGIIELINEQ